MEIIGFTGTSAYLLLAAITVLLILIGLAVYRYLRRKAKQLHRKIEAYGYQEVFLGRRFLLQLAAGLFGLGVTLEYAPKLTTLNTTTNFRRLGNVSLPVADTTSTPGQRRFNLNGAGYDYARWNDDGKLEIHFRDDPPMQEWYLVGPKPDRDILAKGTPPSFGGVETVGVSYPIENGEYLLTGARVTGGGDNIFDVDVDRTGTRRFTVETKLGITSVAAAAETFDVTIGNTGSCPVTVSEVYLNDSMSDRLFLSVQSIDEVLLPREQPVYTVHHDDDLHGIGSFFVGVQTKLGAYWYTVDLDASTITYETFEEGYVGPEEAELE